MRKGSRESDFVRMEVSFVVLMSQESDDTADRGYSLNGVSQLVSSVRWRSFDTSAIYACSRALHNRTRWQTVILCPAIDPVAAAARVGQLLVGLADLLLAARACRCGRRACRVAQRLHGRFPL